MFKLSPIQEIKEKWYLFNDILGENKLSLIYLLMIVINQFAYVSWFLILRLLTNGSVYFQGISCKILTSTGVDLRYIYGVSQYTIDNLNTPMYVAFLFGSFANFLYKYLNRQLVLVLFVLIISVTIGILPHLGAIWAAYLVMACFGIGSGAWEAGNSMWLLEVWPSRIGAIFQVNQFAYNAGGAFSFLLTAPFIWGESVADERNRSLTTQDRQRTLALPFSLTAYIQSISRSSFPWVCLGSSNLPTVPTSTNNFLGLLLCKSLPTQIFFKENPQSQYWLLPSSCLFHLESSLEDASLFHLDDNLPNCWTVVRQLFHFNVLATT